MTAGRACRSDAGWSTGATAARGVWWSPRPGGAVCRRSSRGGVRRRCSRWPRRRTCRGGASTSTVQDEAPTSDAREAAVRHRGAPESLIPDTGRGEPSGSDVAARGRVSSLPGCRIRTALCATRTTLVRRALRSPQVTPLRPGRAAQRRCRQHHHAHLYHRLRVIGGLHRNVTSVISARKNSPSGCRSVPHHQPARSTEPMVTPAKVCSASMATPKG